VFSTIADVPLTKLSDKSTHTYSLRHLRLLEGDTQRRVAQRHKFKWAPIKTTETILKYILKSEKYVTGPGIFGLPSQCATNCATQPTHFTISKPPGEYHNS